MADTRSYTFLPKSAVLYSGQVEDINEMSFENEFIASYKRTNAFSASNYAGLTPDEKTYIANTLNNNPKSAYSVADGGLREDLRNAKIAYLALKEAKRRGMGRNQYEASAMQKIQDAYAKYKAYTADINSDNENQLTIVQFVNKIVGNIETPAVISAAFGNIPLDKLRGKIPEMGWPGVNVQVQRLSEADINETEFGQNEFRIYRNDVHIYVSREDRMEAAIDPMAMSVSQGNKNMILARELLALKACSNLVLNGTYGTMPDITATPSGSSAPASTNDAPKAFVNIWMQHWLTYKNYLKFWIFNPLDYRTYLANWFTHAYERIQIPEMAGVVPFFGLEKYGAVALIHPYVPRTYVYALANEGAYELDGPKIVDAEYDAKKFADYNIVHDFIGYVIMNPQRYGEQISLPQSGVTAGTPITTNAQISKLLQAPSNIVVKNPNYP